MARWMTRLMNLGLPKKTLDKVFAIVTDAIDEKKKRRLACQEQEPEQELLPEGRWPKDYVEQFWDKQTGYPRRIGKAAAVRKLQTIERSGKVEFQVLMEGVRRFRNATVRTEVHFIPHPATWLNAGRWDDDPAAIVASHSNGSGMSSAEIADELRRANEQQPYDQEAEQYHRAACDQPRSRDHHQLVPFGQRARSR